MSCQPFPPALYASPWSVGPDAMQERPRHAHLIGCCVGLWPEVELQLAILLAILLKAEAHGTVAVYMTLRRSTARHESIEAAAKGNLDGEQSELLAAMLSAIRAIEKERNRLAHGLYGSADLLPDSILWIATEDNARFSVEQIMRGQVYENQFDASLSREIATKIFHYSLEDLSRLLDLIKTAVNIAFLFNRYMLLAKYHDDALSRESVYDDICRLAPIAEALRHLRESALRRSAKAHL